MGKNRQGRNLEEQFAAFDDLWSVSDEEEREHLFIAFMTRDRGQSDAGEYPGMQLGVDVYQIEIEGV